jgi:antitoxin VapB
LEGDAMPTLSTPSKPKEAKLFRNNRSQAVRIPVEFELPGDRVLIHREGSKLIIEPVTRPTNIVELLAKWRQEAPLGPDDQFPAIEDMPAKPENII